MSDTPRTDAWKWSGGDDPIEEFHKFACQLERELNEARQIASKYDDRYFATRELLTVSTERAERLERELTEARTRIKELADIGGALADYLDLDDCECSDCQHLSRPVKDWQETVKRCLEGIE